MTTYDLVLASLDQMEKDQERAEWLGERHPVAVLDVPSLRRITDRHRPEDVGGGNIRCAWCWDVGLDYYPCDDVNDLAAAFGVVEA